MKIKPICRKKHGFAWSFYVAVAICTSFSSLYATGNSGIGYHAAPFLRISPTARQVAMGEAAVALADDINLLRYNVGGLGNLHKVMLAANFHNWIEDTQQGGVSLAFPSRYGVLGVDFLYFNEGEIEELDEFFRKTGGTGHSDDIMLTFGYGSYLKLLNNNLSLGASVKVLRQTLVGEQNTTLALDIGSQLRLKHISVGATIQNVGLSRVKFHDLASSLPEIFKLGTAFRLPVNESAKLNIAADIGWTSKEKMRYYLGGELDLSDLLALRTGYKFHDVALSPWSAGFGLNIPMAWLANSRTRLDYAYSPMDVFETSAHRFSIVFTFGVTRPVFALNMDEEMRRRLDEQVAAAERARIAYEDAEARAKALEEEIARRLAQIQSIAEASEGKIEIEPETEKRIKVSMRINFDFDRANIRSEEYETMNRVGEILNTYPEAKVHVSGHTDSIGTEEYNIHLSQRRIDSVMVFLVRKEGVSAKRFYMPIGYGESRPIESNATEEGRFRNRRVEFLLFTFDAVPEMPEGSAVKSVQIVEPNIVGIECNGKVEFELKTLDDPDRLLVDLPGIFLLASQKTVELDSGPFIRARLGFHPEERFTRVVFDLRRKIEPKVRVQDNYIFISTE